MCTVCGCAEGEMKIEGNAPHEHTHPHTHSHTHADGLTHDHAHHHDHQHGHDHPHAHDHVHTSQNTMHYGLGPAHAHAPGLTQKRMVQIEQDILAKNNTYAHANRRWFDEHGIFALNLVSSPGSGKTTLLCKTIELLKHEISIKVVEGDQQTANDAERIRATGVAALQINTGKGCHLDGHMVGHAVESLKPAEQSLFLIENVGNLVCPAAFDLGEHAKVVILSVTEGEDKPLKYPDMFRAVEVMLLNKCDLLPYLQFDVDAALANAQRINPKLRIIKVSATTGEGMPDWLAWIRAGLSTQANKQASTVDALKARIAELERQLSGQ